MDSLEAHLAAQSPLAGPQGQWANKFIQVALKTSFGPIVQIVGDSLVSRGPQSLDELAKHTALDVATLKKCLLTLIQQDLVQAAYEKIILRPGAPKPRRARQPRVLYTLSVDTLRHRSRFASYLLFIKQHFGVECEYILQTLLVHGKLTSAQIMEITCASIEEKNRLAAQELHRSQMAQAALLASQSGAAPDPRLKAVPPAAQPVMEQDRQRIAEVFRQLVSSRYICRAQGLAPPEQPQSAEEAAASSTSGVVNEDIIKTFLANSAASKEAAARQEAAESAVASSASAARKRKKIADDDEEGEEEKEAAKPAKKPKKKTKKEMEAEAKAAAEAEAAQEAEAKRMKDEAETSASLDRAAASSSSSSTGAAGSTHHDDAHILWVVNHAQFLWEFRKKAVTEYVSTTHSPAAAFLISQLLQQYPADCCAKTGGERPPIYDIDQIYELCEHGARTQGVDNPVPTREMVEECIHQLLADQSNFLERKSHPSGYVINFPLLFAELQLKHIQSICRSRYGPLAARIFRCLIVHKRLEESQVSEYATAPRKDVRRILYQLLSAQLLSVQEVPRSSDRMPARTFYLWGVNVSASCRTYLETLYFSWCNLRLRLELETDLAKPVLDKVDTSKIITEQEKVTIEKWKKGADRLEACMHQINQLIMLFQDF